jgi:hypothetical protein
MVAKGSTFKKTRSSIEEINSLLKEEVIIPFDFDFNNVCRDSDLPLLDRLNNLIENYDAPNRDKLIDVIIEDLVTREAAVYLKDIKANDNIFPSLLSEYSYNLDTKKADVFRLTLSKMPVPQESTPWEQITEFRNDNDVQTSYLSLINWINKLANSDKSLSDIEDEFEELYNRYIWLYELHKMKSEYQNVDILVPGSLKAALNPFGWIKSFLSYKKLEISLMEEELNVTGSELAYIYKANEKFGKR